MWFQTPRLLRDLTENNLKPQASSFFYGLRTNVLVYFLFYIYFLFAILFGSLNTDFGLAMMPFIFVSLIIVAFLTFITSTFIFVFTFGLITANILKKQIEDGDLIRTQRF